MSQQQLLAKVVRALEESGSQYMLTGSFASSLQGEPRLTHDIELVVVIQKATVPKLLASFPPPDFFLDKDNVEEAIKAKTMFSLLNVVEGDKVDFWPLTDDPFDVSRFRRKRREYALGMQLFVSSPEDTILAKLRWAKMSGGSEKQFRDSLRVYEVQHDSLDMNYLREWVAALGLDEYWIRLLKEAKP